jgi:hypothetical protein
MRNKPAVTVRYAIVHVADRNAATPLYSEIDLDLETNSVLRNYFTGQVQNALDDETSAARFAASGPQDAKNACDRILAGQANFIAASQELARLLHVAMKTHARIAPGSLAVCVYTTGDDERHVALIKLDPGSALVLRSGTRAGKKLFTFDVQTNVMPTAREKLQKAALLPPAGSEKYDLLLLDRQTPEVAAMWWAETFLNATPIVDGKIGANEFHRANHSAYITLFKNGKTAEADTVMERARSALENKSVKRSAYVQSLPKEARDVVAAELEKKFAGTTTIPIDVKYASEKLTKKTRFRGRYGVIFEVDSDHYDDVVKERTTFEDANHTQITRLVVEVPELQWVK